MKSICGYKTDEDFYKVILSSKEIKDATQKSYVYSFKRITKITGTNLCESILNPKSTFVALQKGIDSKPTLKTTIGAVLAALKYTGEKVKNKKLFDNWYEIYFPLLQENEKQRLGNEPSKKQKDTMVRWEDVAKVHAALGKRKYASSEHLLLSFYYLLKPRRQEDYYRVRILQKKGDKAHSDESFVDLISKTPYIIVKKYKTSDTYKPWTKVLDPKLVQILKDNLKASPRQYVFTQTDKEPFGNRNSYTKYSNRMLKKIFGKTVTVNSLRHAYSTFRNEDRDLTIGERKEDATDMGHSLETHMAYALHKTKTAKKIIPRKFILKKNGKTFVCKELQ